MDLHSIKRVMVRVPNWVGDAVMAEPALRELRRMMASARITFVARPWVAGLFEGEGLADDLIPTEAASGIAGAVSGFVSEVRQIKRQIKQGQFDLAVLLPNSFGAALRARVAGVPNIVGYPTDGRRLLLHHAVPFEVDHKQKHQVRYYLNIAAAIERMLTGDTNIDHVDSQPRLRASQEDKKRAMQLIDAQATQQRLKWSAAKPILAVNPGATNSRAKRWLPERFAQTADQIAEREGCQTIIVGAEGDRDVAAEVAGLMNTEAIRLAGCTTIAELKSVLACSSLVLSNDTGTAHVSAALGVPTVIVFGPTEHIATRPLSDVARVVRHDVECSPCMLRECPIDHRCMTGVEVKDVIDAAQTVRLESRVTQGKP